MVRVRLVEEVTSWMTYCTESIVISAPGQAFVELVLNVLPEFQVTEVPEVVTVPLALTGFPHCWAKNTFSPLASR